MLIKLLSDDDKQYLIKISELLSLSDNPLLWDGKKKHEITVQTNLKNVTFYKDERETTLLQDWGLSENLFQTKSTIEKLLLEKLEAFPLEVVEEQPNRAEAAISILKTLLKNGTPTTPSAIKLMLFELMLLALVNGSISAIEWQILNEFKHHHKLEDFIFQELLTRAEHTHSETQKTIALILE